MPSTPTPVGAPHDVNGSSAHPLLDAFEAVYIIHLRERTDRYHALRAELATIGVDIEHPKIRIMEGQWPESANGFTSIGVHANFMSHMRIIREAAARGVRNVLVLEDDAIFRRTLRSQAMQTALAQRLARDDWGLAFLGHRIDGSILKMLPAPEGGLTPLPPHIEFLWSHCYAISARGLEKLLPYFEETLVLPPGHPRGARMYIDGAYNMFRRWHPEVVSLVSRPRLSSQMGSVSSLGKRKRYDDIAVARPMLRLVRACRDGLWRMGALD